MARPMIEGPEDRLEKALVLALQRRLSAAVTARRQIRLPGGREVDIVTVLDLDPPLVVLVEVKANRAQPAALAQLLGYMDEVRPLVALRWPQARLGGIIAAPSFNAALTAAVDAQDEPIHLLEWTGASQ